MPATLKVTRSKLEDDFAQQVKLAQLPEPERDFKFHPKRKWRLDFAWPHLPFVGARTKWIAVEIQGGIYRQGHHSRGRGQEDDYEKWAEAVKMGWIVLAFGPKQIKSGYALGVIEELLR
jgi:hypothetical protein